MNSMKRTQRLLLAFIAGAGLLGFQPSGLPAQTGSTGQAPKANLLQKLGITPSEESIDYVLNKTQFQLHTLLTEQRHPKTWSLSERIQADFAAGLHMLFSVDEDIEARLEKLNRENRTLDRLVDAVAAAVEGGHTIYVYGCGATGRLAKQMESTFWRPFWTKVRSQTRIWDKLEGDLTSSITERLIGEMTGGDRALISSLEGFEDLLLIGRLQLEDRGIKKGDVVICVTEGGETSSVIGTILAALDQWKQEPGYTPEKSRKSLFFVYNNPDEKLKPFHRSRKVLEEPGITKLNLTTGPQSITGSTRMQATTIETFVIGHVLETALDRVLRSRLSARDMARLGFAREKSITEKLGEFPRILRSVTRSVPELAQLTEAEARTYEAGRFSTYFAQKGLITVFIDSTERSPTFRLFPLDTVREKMRKSWIQVWTPAADRADAWQAFLGRSFRGLPPPLYAKPFSEKIDDAYLRRAALESLKNAGNDQQELYDFAFAEFNLKNRAPEKGDIGVAVLVAPEESELSRSESPFRKFLEVCRQKEAYRALILITPTPRKHVEKQFTAIPGFDSRNQIPPVIITVDTPGDPMGVNQQIALKMALNAHSTAVMARLGKVIGNTMTNVSPSNLKLIGRATYLIQSHVNDLLSQPRWVKKHGVIPPISYGEANAVLYAAIDYLKGEKTRAGQTAEVALSIIQILESLRRPEPITQEEAFTIVRETGLIRYLSHARTQSE